MTNTRKRLIYITVAILVAIAATAGTIFVLQSLKNYNNSKAQDATPKPVRTAAETKADNLKGQAVKATQNNEFDKAKELFKEAKKQYEDLGDTMNVSDIDGQLTIVDQLSAPPKAVDPIEPGAGQ